MSEQLIMCAPDGQLLGQWNFTLVGLSYVTAVGGSFAALDCADRMQAATTRAGRRRYFLAGATLMGLSIWTMHFVGMLALNLGIPVTYDWVLSAVSIFAAALGAGLAFLIVNGRIVTRFHFLIGGVAMGLAIASMHYLGMASMRMPAAIRYNPSLFACSIAIAIGASTGALLLVKHARNFEAAPQGLKLLSALIMGAAIAGMHYVGMAAAHYWPKDGGLAARNASVGPFELDSLLLGAAVIIGGALLALASRNAVERQRAMDLLEAQKAEAVAASRAKDVFLASLSHELRTPLNPALLLATDSANDPAYPVAARVAFAEIARGIATEARLIDDLLDLTRIAHGKVRIELRVVDVHALIRQALRVIQPKLEKKNLHVVLDLNATQSLTRGDPERLQQVLWNLLQNAAKFSDPDRQITVHTGNVDKQISVQVIDSGIGMSANDLEHCFDRFVQGEHTRGGLGLGLSISRSIVELHHGTLTASSAGPGCGSTFTLRLKLAVPSANEIGVEQPALPPQLTLPLKVLVVEDHEPTRKAVEHLLKRRGHIVFSVSTVADALATSQQNQFDLLFSDIGLPDGNGCDLLTAIRKVHPVLGIAVTGYGMESDVRRTAEAGYLTHLTKPITSQTLDAALALVATHFVRGAVAS